jgi:hypothetical protein
MFYDNLLLEEKKPILYFLGHYYRSKNKTKHPDTLKVVFTKGFPAVLLAPLLQY